MSINVELAKFVIEIFGRKGPKVFDTKIAEHNLFLEENLGEETYQRLVGEDGIVIGREGKTINKSDLKSFLEAFEARQNLEIFQNDRNYIFEGVGAGDGEYFVDWGS